MSTPLLPCCGGLGDDYPEHFDTCRLVELVADRWGDRYVTPLGDRRQTPVPCLVCRTDTWALDLLCDRHALERAVRVLRHLDGPSRQAMFR